MSPQTFKRLRKLAIYALPLGALYFAYSSNRNEYYRNMIPSEIKAGSVVEIDSMSGVFGGGCGAAVFEITPDARTETRIPSGSYPAWQETPYVETGDGLTLEDRWTAGLGCGAPNSETMRTIANALNQPGSYYQKLGLAGLVVVPSEGMVAYVYFQ
jgi:hypothetical protein